MKRDLIAGKRVVLQMDRDQRRLNLKVQHVWHYLAVLIVGVDNPSDGATGQILASVLLLVDRLRIEIRLFLRRCLLTVRGLAFLRGRRINYMLGLWTRLLCLVNFLHRVLHDLLRR